MKFQSLKKNSKNEHFYHEFKNRRITKKTSLQKSLTLLSSLIISIFYKTTEFSKYNKSFYLIRIIIQIKFHKSFMSFRDSITKQ